MIAIWNGRHRDRALLSEYAALERAMGHTFRVDLSLDEIERAVEHGEGVQAGAMTGAWNM